VIHASGAGPEGRSPDAGAVSGTLLAFDFGERRIGVAVGETATRIASPLATIDAVANEARFGAIDRLVHEWKPVGFVVGMPRHADGSEHPVATRATRFARRLAGRHRLVVFLVDETLTSAAAEASLREAGARNESGEVDALAAAMILQSYLDDPGRHERLAA
jgi:putative Holliday junction resolvase